MRARRASVRASHEQGFRARRVYAARVGSVLRRRSRASAASHTKHTRSSASERRSPSRSAADRRARLASSHHDVQIPRRSSQELAVGRRVAGKGVHLLVRRAHDDASPGRRSRDARRRPRAPRTSDRHRGTAENGPACSTSATLMRTAQRRDRARREASASSHRRWPRARADLRGCGFAILTA